MVVSGEGPNKLERTEVIHYIEGRVGVEQK